MDPRGQWTRTSALSPPPLPCSSSASGPAPTPTLSLTSHCSLTLRRSSCLPAIHEFPTDLFSNTERQHGAVLLHILGVSGPRRVGCSKGQAGAAFCRARQSQSVTVVSSSPCQSLGRGADTGPVSPTKKWSLKDVRGLVQCHTVSGPGAKTRTRAFQCLIFCFYKTGVTVSFQNA